jgi:uncharacterized low-complexity protein
MKHKKTIVISAALALGLSAGAMAAQSSFQTTQLASGYGHDSSMTKDTDGKCGGKTDMKGADGKCGMTHSKANDGKCGNMDKMTSGATVNSKMKSKTCGNAKCGADKKSMSQ